MLAAVLARWQNVVSHRGLCHQHQKQDSQVSLHLPLHQPVLFAAICISWHSVFVGLFKYTPEYFVLCDWYPLTAFCQDTVYKRRVWRFGFEWNYKGRAHVTHLSIIPFLFCGAQCLCRGHWPLVSSAVLFGGADSPFFTNKCTFLMTCVHMWHTVCSKDSVEWLCPFALFWSHGELDDLLWNAMLMQATLAMTCAHCATAMAVWYFTAHDCTMLTDKISVLIISCSSRDTHAVCSFKENSLLCVCMHAYEWACELRMREGFYTCESCSSRDQRLRVYCNKASAHSSNRNAA